MSAQQIRHTSEEVRTVADWRGSLRIALVIICGLFFAYSVAPVWWFGDAYNAQGQEIFSSGAYPGIAFFGWSFAVPLGMMLGLLGTAVAAKVKGVRIILGVVLGIAVAALPFSVYPGESVPAVFGISGGVILVSLLALVWFWYGRRSAITDEKAQLAADLQMGGYMFFAFAAWFTCGMGSMPAFGLYPEKMIEFGTQPFAVRLMYAISLSFVVGWVLTAASSALQARPRR